MGYYNLGVTRCYGKDSLNRVYKMWDNTDEVAETWIRINLKPLIVEYIIANKMYSLFQIDTTVRWFYVTGNNTASVWKHQIGVSGNDDMSSNFVLPYLILTNMYTYQAMTTETIGKQFAIDIIVTRDMCDDTVGGELPKGVIQDSVWYKHHLLDQNYEKIHIGKYLELEDESSNINGVAIVGAGLVASGFKNQNTQGIFKVLTNKNFIKDTYKFGKPTIDEIRNAYMGYGGDLKANSGFVNPRIISLLKGNVDQAKVNTIKAWKESITGTISKVDWYVVGLGKEKLLQALGFIFDTTLGSWIMRGSAFLALSDNLGGEYAVQYENGQLQKFKLKAIQANEDMKQALEKQADYYQAMGDYILEQQKKKENITDIDETDEETAQREAEEKAKEEAKEELQKQVQELQKQLYENSVKNLDKTDLILEQEAKRKASKIDDLDWAEQEGQSYKNWHSKETKTHTDVQGNELAHTAGLVGMLGGVLPGVLNEFFTRIVAKNLADKDLVDNIKEEIENRISSLMGLYNIQEEELPSEDSINITDYERELLILYNKFKDIKKSSVEVKEGVENGVI